MAFKDIDANRQNCPDSHVRFKSAPDKEKQQQKHDLIQLGGLVAREREFFIDNLGGPASRQETLNPLFQVALHLPS
jgi:hypothetical protein